MGLKAIAVYRDGSKVVQPVSTGKGDPSSGLLGATPSRKRLPDERRAITHKFSIAGHEGYLTVGMYEDGTPGELFITQSKQGSTVSGLMDAFATSISIALQHGVPVSTMVDKFSHLRFEPSGFTNNPEIPMAKSVMDYIFRWLAQKFLTPDGHSKGYFNGDGKPDPEKAGAQTGFAVSSLVRSQEDAPMCHNCGDVMVRSGTCYKCTTCGETSGCS